MSYTDEADALRKQYVKGDEQAPTVQGELLRAIDALREDCIAADGPGWSTDHDLLVAFIRDILVGSAVFPAEDQATIGADLDAITGCEELVDRRPYDRIVERIVQWAELHPEGVPHHPNAQLQR